jgi:hypothetical protein
VPLYVIKAFHDVLFFSSHWRSPLYPCPGGMGILYAIYACWRKRGGHIIVI